MKEIAVDSYTGWRAEARRALEAGLGPEKVYFVDIRSGQPVLFRTQSGEEAENPARGRVTVPKPFLELSETVGLHRDADRWNLLYRTLWRMTHGERDLLKIDVDDDVRRLRLMEKAVHRDIHKMRAFVRFRELQTDTGPEYVAWYKPDHLIAGANAPFFVRRFGAMRWAILTPDESVYWDGAELKTGPGAPRSAAPNEDALEELWRTYYASVFNPARLNLRAMRAEMPVRHWATLPEAQVISGLMNRADSRVGAMLGGQPVSAQPWVPFEASSVEELAIAARGCQGCNLHRCATQAVFGEGPLSARVVLVGEQPGDQEDLAGRPFVGPAGQLLDRALAQAGIDRTILYITNAVKHFKFEERGKRRIHKKPAGVEVSACRPWLEAELALVRPELVVCLGATAAQSLLGRDVRVTQERGRIYEHTGAGRVLVTIHPSALLRLPDPSQFEGEFSRYVEDLRMIAPWTSRAA